MLAAERRRYILEEISVNGRVRMRDLCEEFGVSRMTIHRDLAELDKQGMVQKVFGGAVAVEQAKEMSGSCAMCGMRVRRRTAFVLNSEDGSQVQACCPHCGLMLLTHRPKAVSALAADFLHGRMINVRSAHFLVNPDLTLCCTPTILCFQRQTEAERFQQGFGGDIMNVSDAHDYLAQSMSMERV